MNAYRTNIHRHTHMRTHTYARDISYLTFLINIIASKTNNPSIEKIPILTHVKS